MTGRHTRHIVLTVLTIAVLSTASCAPTDDLRAAAEQGDAVAQYNLGRMHVAGEDACKDDVEAYMWLTLAASSGDSQAAEARDSLSKLMSPEDVKDAKQQVLEWNNP